MTEVIVQPDLFEKLDIDYEHTPEYVIKFEKINKDAILPKRATQYSVGLDLFSPETIYIGSFERKAIHTGIRTALPWGVYGRIAPRSGMALSNGIDVLGGVIDPDYTGEIIVILINLSNESYCIEKHNKIAQLICEKYLAPTLCERKLFTQFAFRKDVVFKRGENGIGSTGK